MHHQDHLDYHVAHSMDHAKHHEDHERHLADHGKMAKAARRVWIFTTVNLVATLTVAGLILVSIFGRW